MDFAICRAGPVPALVTIIIIIMTIIAEVDCKIKKKCTEAAKNPGIFFFGCEHLRFRPLRSNFLDMIISIIATDSDLMEQQT